MFKQLKLLLHFRGYMEDHLIRTGENQAPTAVDSMRRLPYLVKWYRTIRAIVLLLSNGTIQINFFSCHSWGVMVYLGAFL